MACYCNVSIWYRGRKITCALRYCTPLHTRGFVVEEGKPLVIKHRDKIRIWKLMKKVREKRRQDCP